MNPKMVKILTFLGLGMSVAGAIITNVASNQTQKILINEAVNAKLTELPK